MSTVHDGISPGDVIRWTDRDGKHPHDWLVLGIHLGAVGTESVVHVENVSHKPAWTGEWETQVAMYIPECLLRDCEVRYSEKRK